MAAQLVPLVFHDFENEGGQVMMSPDGVLKVDRVSKGATLVENIFKHVGGGPALERGPLASSCEKYIFFPDFKNLWRNN